MQHFLRIRLKACEIQKRCAAKRNTSSQNESSQPNLASQAASNGKLSDVVTNLRASYNIAYEKSHSSPAVDRQRYGLPAALPVV